MRYISKSGRDALINYQYKSSIASWIDVNVMDDFWEKVVTFVPLSVAPNLITFVATVQWLISLFIFSVYCKDLQTCVPSELWYLLAVSLFIYQTLDAIDGKQARRTKQSSPLGELFDHGNDALTGVTILVTCFVAIKVSDGGWTFIFLLIVGCAVFFIHGFQQRHTGVMKFSGVSVTETQLLGIVTFLLTGIFGCDIWDALLPIIHIQMKYIPVYSEIVMGIYTIISKFWSVQKYYLDATKKDPGQIYELLHLLLFIVGILSWNLTGVAKCFPWSYVWITILIFSGIMHRIIVSRVTKMDATKYFHLLNPLFLMIFGSVYEMYMMIHQNDSVMNSEYMVYGILIYVVVFWSLYVSSVINEICDTLNIKLFVIKKQ